MHLKGESVDNLAVPGRESEKAVGSSLFMGREAGMPLESQPPWKGPLPLPRCCHCSRGEDKRRAYQSRFPICPGVSVLLFLQLLPSWCKTSRVQKMVALLPEILSIPSLNCSAQVYWQDSDCAIFYHPDCQTDMVYPTIAPSLISLFQLVYSTFIFPWF